jgi:predicted nucleotide-binding protein
MARNTLPPSVPPKYSATQAVPLLKRQLQRLQDDIINKIYNDADAKAWEQRTSTLLDEVFGRPNGQPHDNTYAFDHAGGSTRISIRPYGGGGPNPQVLQREYVQKQKKREALLKQFIEQLEDEINILQPSVSAHASSNAKAPVAMEGEMQAVRHGTQRTVFIGHGRSLVWRELKDFIVDRLHHGYEEFTREPTAGVSTKERLEEMLKRADFALLVMTAEDERGDGKLYARDNVIHEVGLFQGRLGFKRAIILLEEGCQDFSNIEGLTDIPFPRGKISSVFEEVRRVLEREGIFDLKVTQ